MNNFSPEIPSGYRKVSDDEIIGKEMGDRFLNAEGEWDMTAHSVNDSRKAGSTGYSYIRKVPSDNAEYYVRKFQDLVSWLQEEEDRANALAMTAMDFDDKQEAAKQLAVLNTAKRARMWIRGRVSLPN